MRTNTDFANARDFFDPNSSRECCTTDLSCERRLAAPTGSGPNAGPWTDRNPSKGAGPIVMERSAKLRAFFARYVSERGAVRDPRIEQAFASVPREPFAGPAPWFIAGPLSLFPALARYVQTPDDDPAYLYQDTLIALDNARGINIGEPSFHAFCLQAFALREGATVLHVGAGSGYYTAILAQLVGSSGRVEAFEIDPAFAPRSAANLRHLPWVRVHAKSGVADDLPQCDAIYVSAASTQPSRGWLRALRPGGTLLFPMHGERDLGGMLLVQRPIDPTSLTWSARFITRALFVGCQGAQDRDTGCRLNEAFSGAINWREVRSLRFETDRDETCWCDGVAWWLSTADPILLKGRQTPTP